MDRPVRVGIDVDGVVADLMGGFEKFIRSEYGHELRPSEITCHRITRSPAHRELHERIDLDRRLANFLALPDVYQNFVDPIDGALDAIDELCALSNVEVAFITATLHESPQSYSSKYRWLDWYFPRLPVISCPAQQKHWVGVDYGIDDRYDTCARWAGFGTLPILFRQPWNEAPEGFPSYDWPQIVIAIKKGLHIA